MPNNNDVSLLRRILAGGAFVALASCATYRPEPLPAQPNVALDVPRLQIDTARIAFPELARHRFDPADGLDMTETATLAVVNNPELKIARDKTGVARAQAFAAGLLPDPQLSFTRDFPQGADPALTSAFNLGLSYDLNQLITRGTAKQAAGKETHKADLELLWQEWQVVAKARLLFVQTLTQERLVNLLREESALFRNRYERAQRALADGNLTVDRASTYLAALQGIDRKLNDAERKLNRDRHDLNALLGLAPGVRFTLTGDADLPALDAAAVRRRLPDLPRYRPDLLALQAGYDAQEARLRQAILAQFPAFNLGLARARDTAGVYTEGFAITLTLPIFNRNRGNIAIQRATRRRLYDEYQIRLNAAYSDVDRLLANQGLLARQREDLGQGLAELERAAQAAETAYRDGIMDELHYVNLKSALIDKRIEMINLDQLTREQRIALQTLVGTDASTVQEISP